jgi:hypothetical protein
MSASADVPPSSRQVTAALSGQRARYQVGQFKILDSDFCAALGCPH